MTSEDIEKQMDELHPAVIPANSSPRGLIHAGPAPSTINPSLARVY